MKVYYNSNFWGTQTRGLPLERIRVERPFVWEELEGYIPAVYTGDAGAVLDVCIRVPSEKVEGYLAKWSQKARLSCASDEELEQMEQENPFSLDFTVDLAFDGTALESGQQCSTCWYPPALAVQDIKAETEEELMREYRRDPTSGWLFVRCTYSWRDCPVQPLEKLSLHFRERKAPAAGGYFTASVGCGGGEFEAVHPVTKARYIITLHECASGRMKPEELNSLKDTMEYPVFYQVLSYSISPEILREEYRICDCSESDAPRDRHSKRECRSSAVYVITGYAPIEKDGTLINRAVSSLYFNPVREVRWRVVFQIKKRKDLEISFML